MPINSELHIIIPGLCGPLAEIRSLKQSREFTLWLKRLSRSKCSASHTSAYQVIASIFNLQYANDFPSAALTLLANDMYDDNKYYMSADPVHLQADLNQAVLTSSEDLTIDKQESAALIDTLNNHFQQDGLEFFSADKAVTDEGVATDKKGWFVSTENLIDMRTTSLVDAVGRDVNFILPKGKDATHWNKVLTEAQMLMFSHAVNAERENSAQATINSLWFYGCGGLPDISGYQRRNNKVSSVCGDQIFLKGVADLVGCDYQFLPATVDDYTERLFRQVTSDQKNKVVNVLQLSALEHLVNYTDVSVWREKLIELLENWIYPILKMANRADIQITLYPCAGQQYRFSKYDFLKIWRQEKLEQHVRCY